MMIIETKTAHFLVWVFVSAVLSRQGAPQKPGYDTPLTNFEYNF